MSFFSGGFCGGRFCGLVGALGDKARLPACGLGWMARSGRLEKAFLDGCGCLSVVLVSMWCAGRFRWSGVLRSDRVWDAGVVGGGKGVGLGSGFGLRWLGLLPTDTGGTFGMGGMKVGNSGTGLGPGIRWR